MLPGMEKIIELIERGGSIEGRVFISDILVNISGLYGVFFR